MGEDDYEEPTRRERRQLRRIARRHQRNLRRQIGRARYRQAIKASPGGIPTAVIDTGAGPYLLMSEIPGATTRDSDGKSDFPPPYSPPDPALARDMAIWFEDERRRLGEELQRRHIREITRTDPLIATGPITRDTLKQAILEGRPVVAVDPTIADINRGDPDTVGDDCDGW